MDAKLLYWTAALANLLLAVLCGARGVRRIRRRDVRGHRRMMLSAAGLVALFLLSYVFKVLLLGKEDRGAWDRTSLVSLYVHETGILVMLLGGALAAARSLRFRRLLDAFPFDADRAARSDALARARRQHRRAGWTALIGAGLAFAMATLVLLGMYARAARAEEPAGAAAPPPAPAAAPAPALVPIPEVAERSEQALGELREVERRTAPEPAVAAIEAALPARRNLLRQEAREIDDALRTGPALREISDLEDEWRARADELARWGGVLSRRAAAHATDLERLAALRALWERTQEAAGAEAAPPAVQERIRGTLETVERVDRGLRQRQAALLTLQSRVSEQQLLAGDSIDRLRRAREDARGRLFEPERPPLWRELAAPRAHGSLREDLRAQLQGKLDALAAYARSRGSQLAATALVFLGLLVGVTLLDRRLARWTEADPHLPPGVRVFARPLSVALLATLALAPWLFALAPRAARDLVALIFLIPLLRLLPPLLDPASRPWFRALFALFLLDRVRDVLAPVARLEPLLFPAELLAALATLGWLARAERLERLAREESARRVVALAVRLALVLLGLALVGRVLGYASLSQVLGEGVIRSGFLAIGLFGAVRIARLAILVLGSTRRARSLGLVRRHGSALAAWGSRLSGWAAIAVWAWLTLDLFAIRQPAFELLAWLLTTPVTLGTMSFSLGDLLAFAATLGSALLLSAALRALLEDDVFPRLRLRRGVPQAVSATLHYALLFAGFVLAIGAAGIDLSRFALLAGAFGVGLGFGLQNVVSNFVSGLILLYERPIQVGDSVDVGGLLGEVRRIGIRSSTVRTWDGAEVIVPNASLLENQVVNWTLSDRQRRIDLRVGVAYGIDPHRVLAILIEVARGHPELLADPPPVALFLGFGESSLDFELRAWTANYGVWVRIRSELALGVHDALKRAGIEIPFPQRDLHLRSVDPSLGVALGPRAPRERPPE